MVNDFFPSFWVFRAEFHVLVFTELVFAGGRLECFLWSPGTDHQYILLGKEGEDAFLLLVFLAWILGTRTSGETGNNPTAGSAVKALFPACARGPVRQLSSWGASPQSLRHGSSERMENPAQQAEQSREPVPTEESKCLSTPRPQPVRGSIGTQCQGRQSCVEDPLHRVAVEHSCAPQLVVCTAWL